MNELVPVRPARTPSTARRALPAAIAAGGDAAVRRFLEAGGTLENAQVMAAHKSPRTTKLYDRTGDEIKLHWTKWSGLRSEAFRR